MEYLKYTDEEDKSYGLAGMSIAAVVWDEIEAIDSVNLDGTDDGSVVFAQDYVYAAPSGGSVKSVWEQAFMHYRLCARLMLANVACRRLVLKKEAIPSAAVAEMKRIVAESGAEHCSLEKDETDMVFEKNYDSVIRIFSHAGVQEVVREFARTLKASRSLSAGEIIEHLHRLRMM